MSDHADTIRRDLQRIWNTDDRRELLAALDALLAERQEAIDALREADEHGSGAHSERVIRETLARLGEHPQPEKDIPSDTGAYG